MGKKSRAKRKRERSAQAPKQAAEQGFRLSSQTESILNSPMPEAIVSPPAVEQSVGVQSDNHIRRDIIRILILLACVAVILLALDILNHKTPLLRNAGRRFSIFLELQHN